MGCDSIARNARQSKSISIHAARMGCDLWVHFNGLKYGKFQSTQPEWAATKRSKENHARTADFNPRSPNGLRPKIKTVIAMMNFYFNPRSPNGLRRLLTWAANAATVHFNPRSPNGLRRNPQRVYRNVRRYFNPRSPNGLRLYAQLV